MPSDIDEHLKIQKVLKESPTKTTDKIELISISPWSSMLTKAQ